MAFLDVGSTEKKERFSLLLLDPGEIYFEDFSAYYYPPGLSEEEAIKRRQKGWLKICSKSLVFDPKDVHFPILKLTFSNVTKMDKWIGPLFSRVDVKNKMIMVETSQSIQMKANNQVTPYVFIREQERHLFCLNFAKVDDCLPQMCQLQRASTLPSADQITMINAIVAGRQLRVNFDTSWLDDLYEKIVMETQGDRITPLVTNPGRIMLTSSRLYFQPFNNVDPLPVLKIKIADIRRIIKRRFLLRHVGIEIFNENNTQCPHLYLTLKSEDARNTLYDAIIKQPGIKLEDSNTENVTLKWQNRIISNYEYLSYLNSMSDRSTNDLTQYPVFPWVIADYSSGTLDLQNPETYRDLSKPIGALNEERLQRLLERYNEMPEPRFLYGSHYSTPGFVLFYLARVAPEYMLCLQNGRFDHPDRMFNSLQDAWKNCQESFSDFKELIPEFYDSTGTFLTNNPLVNFGVKFDGKPVLSVELPPWATDSVDFINKLRAALESEYVSQNIHHWIDLIFGYKQRGEESEKAQNVFYYLTYEGAIDLESIDDPNQRSALEAQIMEFGQTPKQLFTSPHPPRGRLSPENCPLVNPAYQQPQTADKLDRENNTIETPEDHQDSCTAQTKCYWSNMDKLQSFAEHKLHKEQISDVRWGPNKKTVYSVSQDTLLKVYSLEEKLQLRSIQLSNMALSCCLIPDDKTILAGCWDNNIYIYSFEFGRIIDCIYAHDDAISHMCLEKNLLVSSSWDSTVKLWNCSEGSKGFHVEYKGEFDHEAGVTSLCMHTDGTSIATGTRDGQVITWDSSTNVPLLQLQGHTGTVTSASYSQDGKRLMTCGEDQYLKVTDISTGTQVYIKDTGHNLKCAVWDGKTVIAGTSDGQLLMWDLVAVKLVKKIHSHQGAVTCLNASQDGNLLSGGEDRVVKAWYSLR